ncbi:MAG: lysophospholipid acyltransferase family protein [Saprospiraceae bacterium]
MALFMLVYGISCLFIPHSKERALQLRKNYLKYWAIPVLNIHIEVEGTPSKIPSLYVSNHRSFADPIVVCRYLDAFVIAKAEVADYPIINKGAELTGVVWVNRSNKDSRAATRYKMVEIIKLGYNVLVFPEGTVGIEKNTLPFHKGTFIEAAEHNFPLIPITIEYKSKKDLWVIPNLLLQYAYQFAKWKTVVSLKFGAPIQSTDGESMQEYAYQWINQSLHDMHQKWEHHFATISQ